ncbi:MAG: hypothetical protein JWO45_2190 [Spartobacteria bacterium]|nr:hypothetical protein [Spartobacteria bacterium]
MSKDGAPHFKLTVLNPGGRDPEQYFDEGVSPSSTAHPPVNFHAFAASTRGSFHSDVRHAIAEKTPILLLLRGDFKLSQRALIECQRQKRKVVISLKETGLHQIAQQMADPAKLGRFLQIVAKADGCIGTTPEATSIYRECRGKDDGHAVFVPTPYPLEDRSWDFSVPPNKQSGILIGTREWDVPSRNHFAALLLARELCQTTGESVTVFNPDGRKGVRRLGELNFPADKLRVIEKRKAYPDYLREMARHKIVLQLDRSRVPGQVAGDALLCRTICVGGDGAIEQIAFPKTCGAGRNIDQIGAITRELLTNTNARGTVFVESQWRSMERLSFEAVRKQLSDFFAQL